MSTKNRGRLHAVMDARLSAIARSMQEPLPWNQPWLRLGPESTWEERLFVCQAVRNSGSVSAEAGYFLVSWIIEDLAIVVESERVDSLEFMNRRESRRATDRSFANPLDQHGEHEMAERFRTDPLEHARRREVGRRFFFEEMGEEPLQDPAWIKEFVRTVSSSLLTDRSTPRLGIRYRGHPHFLITGEWVAPSNPLVSESGCSFRPTAGRRRVGRKSLICRKHSPGLVTY